MIRADNTKKVIGLVILASVIAAMGVSGCTINPNGVVCNETNETDELIMITDGMAIDDDVCEARGVKDDVVIFHSPGCPACEVAVPRLEELEQELGMEFVHIDVSDGRERMMEMGLIPAKIPTVIIKCKVYVGAREKEEYRSLIEG